MPDHPAVYVQTRSSAGEVTDGFAYRSGVDCVVPLLSMRDDDGTWTFDEVVARHTDGSGSTLFRRGNDWPA